jgi:hypothetical protein
MPRAHKMGLVRLQSKMVAASFAERQRMKVSIVSSEPFKAVLNTMSVHS